MRRPNVRQLVLKTVACKGPITDAELGWYIRVALAQNPASAIKKRRELTKAGLIRFARKVKITESGHVQKKWEIAPKKQATPE